MTMTPSVSDDELSAYLDGELDAERRLEISTLLAGDPGLSARVAAYAADRERLRRALAVASASPLPPAWAARIEAATARPARPVLSRRYAVAAGIALALTGSILGSRGPANDGTILAEAQAAREGRAAGGRRMPAEALTNASLRDGVVRAAVGMPVRAPDLRRFGFGLRQVDLFPHAVQLSYDDARGRVLTVFIRPSDGKVQFDLLRQGPTRICVWQDDVVGAVMMAPMSAGEMMRVAGRTYGDLNL